MQTRERKGSNKHKKQKNKNKKKKKENGGPTAKDGRTKKHGVDVLLHFINFFFFAMLLIKNGAWGISWSRIFFSEMVGQPS